MKTFEPGSLVIWRELDPAQLPGDGEPRFVEHDVIVRSCTDGTYEIEVDADRVVHVNGDSLRPFPPCEHPEHRLGTHGRLRSNQRVCMNCGDVVLVRRR